MSDKVHSDDFMYWVKATLGMQITKDGLVDFAQRELQNFIEKFESDDIHFTRFLQSILDGDRVTYKKPKRSRPGQWTYNACWRSKCCEVCDDMFDKLLENHARKETNIINWKCHDKSKITPSNHWWILAKIYIPDKNQNIHSSTGPDEVDALAIFSLPTHCELFTNIKHHALALINVRNKLMHSATSEINKDEMKELFDKMKALLNEKVVYETSCKPLHDLEELERDDIQLIKTSEDEHEMIRKALKLKKKALQREIAETKNTGDDTSRLEQLEQKTNQSIMKEEIFRSNDFISKKKEIEEQKNKIQELNDKKQEQKDKIQAQNKKIQEQEDELLEQKNTIQKQKDEIEEMKNKIQEQKDEKQEQKEKIQGQKDKIQYQEDKIQEQEDKIQEQEDKKQEQEDKIQEQEDKIKVQEDKIQEQEDKIQEQEDKIQDQEDKIQEQEDKIQEQKDEIQEKIGKIQETEIHEQKDKTQEQIDEIQEKKDKIHEQEDDIQEQKDIIQKKKDKIQKDEIYEQKDKIQEQKNEIQEKKDKIQEQEDTIQEQEDIIQEHKVEIQDLRQKIYDQKHENQTDESSDSESEDLPAMEFEATLTSCISELKVGTTVIFDSVLTNVGQAYDPATGIFEAKSNGGPYRITVDARTWSQKAWSTNLQLYLMRNLHQIGCISLSANRDDSENARIITDINLKSGDHVFVKSGCIMDSVMLDDINCRFEGYLL